MQRSVDVEATINELKNDSHTPEEEKSSLYHFKVKFPQGEGNDLELNENATNTKRGR